PGSGGARLQLTADGAGGTYRVRVVSHNEDDTVAPAAPQHVTMGTFDQQSASFQFAEPGDDGLTGPVSGFDVRYLAGAPLTEANFMGLGKPWSGSLVPHGPGTEQTVALDRLLPQTHYYVGVRAYDKCKNYGPLAVVDFTTAERQNGYVDACFVATAAYG